VAGTWAATGKGWPMNAMKAPGSFLVFPALLFLTHLLASLEGLPLAARQGVWVAGLLASFWWMKISRGERLEKALLPGDRGAGIFPAWAWWVLLAAGFAFRSFRFWAFPHWPLLDESNTVQAALELNRHWDWRFFYSEGQSPPLLNWATAFLLKSTDRPFFALLVPPFAVSCLTLLLAWRAARLFFPEEPAFLFTAFWAFGFWPVYLQAFSLQAACLPLWEMGVFFLLALLLARKREKDWARLLLLGGCTGMGYWTYPSWPVVAAAVMAVLWRRSPRFNEKMKGMGSFAAGFALAAAYFGAAVVRNGGYGTHFVGYSAFSGWFQAGKVLLSGLDYVNGIFWGHWSDGAYAPARGGFLNPLEASFFWLGIWGIGKSGAVAGFFRKSAAAFVWFLAPGFLSQNLQFLRTIQVIPLALALSAWGFFQCLQALPRQNRKAFLTLVLSAGLAWNAWRLAEAFSPIVGQTAPIRTVYQTLEKIQRDQGPGIILTQFKIQNHPEENLAGAVFPFNAAQNERLDFHRASWAALLVHADEVPFLAGNFPSARWWKPSEPVGDDGEFAVGWIPILAREGPRIEAWMKADGWLQMGDWKSIDVSNSKTYQEALRYWLDPPALMKEDPFLQSCYWERLSEFYYLRGYEKHYELQVRALRNAVDWGYPAPHLYFDLGCLLLRGGRYPEARRSLERALVLDPGNPSIRRALGLLGQMERGRRDIPGKNGPMGL
jgi:tetratricopeptide (TPR) repeat protein